MCDLCFRLRLPPSTVPSLPPASAGLWTCISRNPVTERQEVVDAATFLIRNGGEHRLPELLQQLRRG